MQIFKLITFILVNTFALNAYADNIVSHEYYIPYNGQKIHLQEKKLSLTKPNKVIVFINPLSIPALTAFDVPNYSLMDAFAKHGYDVWALDFIGQGRSSYPKVMESSPAQVGIYPLSANEAVKELGQVMSYISKATGKNSVSILGWSWGSVVGAMYAIQHPKSIDHLILYGSMYSSPLPEYIQPIFIKPFTGNNNNFSKNLPAYQNIPWEIIKAHWKMMINGNSSIAQESAIEAVAKVYIAADPKPVITNSLRRAMGPMKDLYSIWNGKPIYNIRALTTPTLVIYGDQDLFADHGLYVKLTNVKVKQEIELKEATHWLIYEKTRDQFIDDVVKFLNDK